MSLDPSLTTSSSTPIRILGNLDAHLPSHLPRDESQEYRIALAQLLPSHDPTAAENIQAGLRTLERYARRAKECGADVIVFPEYFLTGALHSDWSAVRSSRSPIASNNIAPADGNPDSSESRHFLQTVISIAKELSIDICAGTTVELGMQMGERHLQHRRDERKGEDDERPEEERLFNTAYYVDRDGVVKGKYTKRNLWHPERILLSPATDESHPEPRVFEIENGRGRTLRASILICWDLAFPEEFRALLEPPKEGEEAMRGPDVIFMPTCWYATDAGPRGLRWNANGEGALLDAFTLTRAIETECIIALSNVSGPSPRSNTATTSSSTTALSTYLSSSDIPTDVDPPLIGLGHSSISAPFLGCIAKVGDEQEALLLGAVDLRVLEDARETYRVRYDIEKTRMEGEEVGLETWKQQ